MWEEIEKEAIAPLAKNYKYAWLHCVDKLEFVKSENLSSDFENLIEARFFGAGKEVTIKRGTDLQSFQKSKEWVKEDQNQLEEQQIISHNKIKKLFEDGALQERKDGSYVIELGHELGYESDGQAYIACTHMSDIHFRKYAKEMEV